MNFVAWQSFNMELRAGTQVCTFKERIRAKSLNYLKLEITSTHQIDLASLGATAEPNP